jgi:hypothetical protein
MAAIFLRIRTTVLILCGCAVFGVCSRAQTETAPAPAAQSSVPLVTSDAPTVEPAGERPLPDIVAIMHEVEINQRKAEAIEKNYLYHSVETAQELDGHGRVKKTTITEADHYFVNGIRVLRLVKKDGKALSPEEIAREDQRIEKEAAKAREKRDKADTAGKPTDSRGDDEITVSRLIELGAFANARRVQLHGRDTIAVDYVGDPKAKTHNRAEDAIRDLSGTAWIDEGDRMLVRVEGQFVNSFKVGGGLVASIQKGTHFTMEQTKVNDEVWLPASISAQGAARVLLFFNFNGNIHAIESDYRKFRATSTVLPGVTQVDPPQTTVGPSRP